MWLYGSCRVAITGLWSLSIAPGHSCGTSASLGVMLLLTITKSMVLRLFMGRRQKLCQECLAPMRFWAALLASVSTAAKVL